MRYCIDNDTTNGYTDSDCDNKDTTVVHTEHCLQGKVQGKVQCKVLSSGHGRSSSYCQQEKENEK